MPSPVGNTQKKKKERLAFCTVSSSAEYSSSRSSTRRDSQNSLTGANGSYNQSG